MVIKFNNDLETLGARFYSDTRIAGDDYHIKFGGNFTAIVTINTNVGSGYATYLVQGYGPTSSRCHLIELCKKEAITKFMLNEESSPYPELLILCSNYASELSIFMIQGELISVI